MIPVPSYILQTLSMRFAFTPDALIQLGGGRGDSDGICYVGMSEGEKRVLKIVAKKADDPLALFTTLTRARFFAYLGQCGVPVVAPEPNAANNLVERADEGQAAFLAYAYPYLPGGTLKPEHWSDGVLESWGALIGRTHCLTRDYSDSRGVFCPDTGKAILCWQEEMDGFTNWCSDEDVKAVWRDLRSRVELLDDTPKTCGFIHNDPHMENLLIDKGRLSLIDFDVANRHFFMCDLAIAIQSVLFTKAGGLERPLTDKAALEGFVTPLLRGYEREISLPSGAMGQIDLFIAYRRALLFTVMYDWLKTKPDALASWKKMTLEEPPVLGLLFA